MKYKVGDYVKTTNLSGAYCPPNGVVVIIDNVDETNKRPYTAHQVDTREAWRFSEIELEPITIGDSFRFSSDEELAEKLTKIIVDTCRACLDQEDYNPAPERWPEYKQYVIVELKKPF